MGVPGWLVEVRIGMRKIGACGHKERLAARSDSEGECLGRDRNRRARRAVTADETLTLAKIGARERIERNKMDVTRISLCFSG